jgi:hypothetical protein
LPSLSLKEGIERGEHDPGLRLRVIQIFKNRTLGRTLKEPLVLRYQVLRPMDLVFCPSSSHLAARK